MSRTIVISAGGSGGHIFPAQALADKMLTFGWRVIFVTDKRGTMFTSTFDSRIELTELRIKSPSKLGIKRVYISVYLILVSIFKSFSILLRVKSSFVVGFGGYPTFPVLLAAKFLGITRIIHEQNSVLGRVNAIFANSSSLLVYGIEPYKKESNKLLIKCLGTPIRESILKYAGSNYEFDRQSKITLCILGGSQGASFISHIFINAVRNLPAEIIQKLFIIHQCRIEDEIMLTKSYRNLGIKNETKTFYTDLGEKLSNSQLVISRAGASTISELCIVGRPSILIPLPTAVGNHQYHNALALEKVGGAKLVCQKELSSISLSNEIMTLLSDDDRIKRMASLALSHGKPNAALKLADEIVQMSETN